MQTLKFPQFLRTGLNKCPYLYFRDEKTESPRDKIFWSPISFDSRCEYIIPLRLPFIYPSFVFCMVNEKYKVLERWRSSTGHPEEQDIKSFQFKPHWKECASSHRNMLVYHYLIDLLQLKLSLIFLPSPPLLLSLSILLSFPTHNWQVSILY